MTLAIRSLSEADAQSTSFTRQQNRTVLIAGLTCACFSVLATLVTLRWFILMKRTFRHKLIMFLILSDMFKALWYFLFPVVVFSRGMVASSSAFCQASGFFLAVGIEASDFAILMIALHSILYIFHPPTRTGESGGLHPWRKYIYPLWVGLPILAASLAFISQRDAYATAGTICYLPRRPFWYRLALAWIPRYFIILLILSMYMAVYIYVALRFRSFSNLHDSDETSSRSNSRRSSLSGDEIAPDEPVRSSNTQKTSRFSRPVFPRTASYDRNQAPIHNDPWDEVSFITSKHLRASGWQSGIQASDFAIDGRASGTASPHARQPSDQLDPVSPESRKVSNCPTMSTQYTGDTVTTSTPPPESRRCQDAQAVQKLASSPTEGNDNDPLRKTRRAIRKQLRYLFIYPAVYLLMWIFPFASHCLLYNDYYVQNPIYWLTVVATCMLSLQAGVDCIVFSVREKPWRRIPDGHRLSVENIRHSFSLRHTSYHGRSKQSSMTVAHAEPGTSGGGFNSLSSEFSSRAASANWWEAEGKKRKDSVWMGTDNPDNIGGPSGRRETVARPLDLPSPLKEADESEMIDHIPPDQSKWPP